MIVIRRFCIELHIVLLRAYVYRSPITPHCYPIARRKCVDVPVEHAAVQSGLVLASHFPSTTPIDKLCVPHERSVEVSLVALIDQ
jgi:hypothetical protein